MDRAHAPIHPPPRVSRAGHPAGLYPQAWQDGKAPPRVPTVSDRALQRSTAEVLAAIYEQDFLPCSFGGRPKLSAHHALATLNEVVAGGMISWVLEADLKNFFGSLSHDWVPPLRL